MSAAAPIVVETRLLDVLDKPQTAREAHEELLKRVWHAWVDDNGLGDEVEWDERGWPVEGLVRLLGWSWASSMGFAVDKRQVEYRLRKLHRDGKVRRIDPPEGHRGILWVAASLSPLDEQGSREG